MKLRKVLAAFAAAAVAASAMAITSFAATYSGSHTMADSTWWTEAIIMDGSVSSLIGDLDPASVTSITFTSDTTFVVGYNNKAGGWSQSPEGGVKEATYEDVLLESYTDAAGEKHDPHLKLCLSKGDGVNYTINWTVNAADAPAEPAEPDEPTTPDEPTAEPDEPTEEPEETEEPAYEETEEPGDLSDDVNDYFDGSTLILVADDGSDAFLDASDIDLTDIYGITFKCTFDDAEVADEETWIGGGIGSNSNSTGWAYTEWGRVSKPIFIDFENGTIQWLSDEPIFQDDEEYAQLFIQTWGGTVTVDEINLLGADGEVIAGNELTYDPVIPAETEESGDDNTTTTTTTTTGTDSKGSPDTGVAGVAAAAGVAALAGVAVVVARKRK